jgi:hypothetical protein
VAASKSVVRTGRGGLSRPVRIGLAVLGVFMGLIGSVAWGLETEYGSSGTNFGVEVIGNEAKVYDVNEQTGAKLVFEGTEAEAMAYTEEQRIAGRNYLIPGLILAGATGLVLVAAVPGRSRATLSMTDR